MSTGKEASHDDSELEEAFRLIRNGNEQEEANDHWKAADSFSQARAILARLARTATSKKQKDGVSTEQEKIASLYHQQSIEYLKRARGALIAALKKDTVDDSDHDRVNSSSISSSNTKDRMLLSEEECFFRMKLFGRLFAKEPEDLKSVQEQESLLENRLRHLSDSLPSSLKSEKERMRDLNKGLARLGLSLIPTSEETSSSLQQQTGRLFGLMDEAAPPKSEMEQIDDIIAQAKDEVVVLSGNSISNDGALAAAAAVGQAVTSNDDDDGGGSGAGVLLPDVTDTLLDTVDATGSSDDASVIDSAADDDIDNDDDAVLTPEICKVLQGKLVAAQVSLAELVALFEVDQDEDAEIEFDQARGKQILNDARLLLRQVTKKWEAR